MIDDNLLKQCQSDLADFGSLTPKKVNELVKNYQSLIEMNAELHKENAKLKKVKSDAFFEVGHILKYEYDDLYDQSSIESFFDNKAQEVLDGDS